MDRTGRHNECFIQKPGKYMWVCCLNVSFQCLVDIVKTLGRNMEKYFEIQFFNGSYRQWIKHLT